MTTQIVPISLSAVLIFTVLLMTMLTPNLASIGEQSQGVDTTDRDVNQWFQEYDSVRRAAKMSLREKLSMLRLLSLSLSPFGLPVDESKKLLVKIIDRYDLSRRSLENLAKLPQTEELQRGYIKYFSDAKQVFQDAIQTPLDDPEAQRKRLSELLERKRQLERLDIANKALDARLRKEYHVLPFHG